MEFATITTHLNTLLRFSDRIIKLIVLIFSIFYSSNFMSQLFLFTFSQRYFYDGMSPRTEYSRLVGMYFNDT